jgi:hypothetical protein
MCDRPVSIDYFSYFAWLPSGCSYSQRRVRRMLSWSARRELATTVRQGARDAKDPPTSPSDPCPTGSRSRLVAGDGTGVAMRRFRCEAIFLPVWTASLVDAIATR